MSENTESGPADGRIDRRSDGQIDTESIWKRLVGAAGRPSAVSSDSIRRELLADAMTVGLTITADSVGCSITETLTDGFRTPVASSRLAMDLDDAQYADDDGPCIAACRDLQVHSISIMADEQSYPGFRRAALAHGVRSSLSLPLTGLQRPSALNLYARHPLAFEPPHARAVAMLLSRCTAAVLTADPFTSSPSGGQAVNDAEPAGRPTPAQAVDAQLMDRALTVLADREGLDRREAFDILAKRSRAEARSIFVAARDVIAGGEA